MTIPGGVWIGLKGLGVAAWRPWLAFGPPWPPPPAAAAASNDEYCWKPLLGPTSEVGVEFEALVTSSRAMFGFGDMIRHLNREQTESNLIHDNPHYKSF